MNRVVIRTLLALMLCVTTTLPLLAQESEHETSDQHKEEPNKETYFKQYSLGLLFSSYKGSGISVGIPLTERVNLGTTALIYFSKNGDREETTRSFGLSLSYDVFESINRRFYLGAGLGRDRQTTKFGFNNERNKDSFRYGLSAGVELRSSESKGFYFLFDVGYHTIYRDSLTYIGLGGGFGFGYIF